MLQKNLLNEEKKMALNFNSIEYDTKLFELRLDSKYYHLKQALECYESENKEDVINFWSIMTWITDWEHAWQTFVDKWVLFLKNSSIKDFDISLYDWFYITEAKHKSLSRSALHEEDVLFTTIWHLWTAAIVPKGFWEANMNQNFVKISVNKEKISPYYVVCFLNSKVARWQIKNLLTWNIQSILTYPKIKWIKIFRPHDKTIEKEIENNYKNAINLWKEALKIIDDVMMYLDWKFTYTAKSKWKKYFSIWYEDLLNECSLWTPKYFCPEYIETEEYLKNNFKYESLWKISSFKNWDEPWSEFYIDYLEKEDTDVPFIRTSDIYNYQIDHSPDNFVENSTFEELNQDIQEWDIIYTKDWKIWEIAFSTGKDKAVYASWLEILRINKYWKELWITPEYLFAVLNYSKIWRFSADRYTVVASTIPHIKEDFIMKFIIPILGKEDIEYVTENIKEAFKKINDKKILINRCLEKINETLHL